MVSVKNEKQRGLDVTKSSPLFVKKAIALPFMRQPLKPYVKNAK